MHLRYCYNTAYNEGISEHAQKQMRGLGVDWQHATPQTMGDQWWFWNCSNVPKVLPAYIKILDIDPMDCIGHGLTEEMAKEINSL